MLIISWLDRQSNEIIIEMLKHIESDRRDNKAENFLAMNVEAKLNK